MKNQNRYVPLTLKFSYPLFFILLSIGGGNLYAAEPHVGTTSGTITSEYLEYRSRDRVMLAKDNVVFFSSGTYFLADNVLMYASSQTFIGKGNVHIQNGEMLVLAEDAHFNWEQSSGTFSNAYMEQSPWRVWGQKMIRVSSESYKIRQAAVTSCDLDPPHYHFKSWRSGYKPNKRLTSFFPRLALGKTSILAFPFITRSLDDKRWTFTVDPGVSEREGVFTKSIFTYPLTENTKARVYWDYFQNTGNGFGGEYTYTRPDVRGSLYGYRINDRLSQSERWTGRLVHWQQLKPRWTLQASALAQSDSQFSNQFDFGDFVSTKIKTESDASLSYQHPKYSARFFVEHDRIFDAVKNRFVRQKTVLPQVNLQTSPLKLGPSDVYMTWGGNVRNEYTRPQEFSDRADPIFPKRDLFRLTGNSALSFQRLFRIKKNMSLTPSLGMSQDWKSWEVEGSSDVDHRNILVGKGFTGLNWRHRMTRAFDYNITHTYRVLWKENTFKRDRENPAHQGTESNSLAFLISYRPSRKLWVRGNTAYNLHQKEGEILQSIRRKFTPPQVEVRYKPYRWMQIFYRQIEQLYPVRKPQSAQFSFDMGKSGGPRFNTGYSYNTFSPGELRLWHTADFSLTKNWEIEGTIRYRASGTGRLNYDAVQITEKELVVKRDLHCWRARFELNERPGVQEFFFRIDIKASVKERRKNYSEDEEQFYPDRDRDLN